MLTWGGSKATPSNEGQKMQYLVLKSCFAAGERRNAGDVVDLGLDEAAALSSYGRVTKAPAPKPEPKTVDRAAKPKSTRKKSDED